MIDYKTLADSQHYDQRKLYFGLLKNQTDLLKKYSFSHQNQQNVLFFWAHPGVGDDREKRCPIGYTCSASINFDQIL